jgi:hypothetical protein
MASNTQRQPVSKGALWTGRILSALLALALLAGGAMAFLKTADVAKQMEKYGYGDRFVPILGAVEIICALLYLIPQTAIFGAILITGYMGGAVSTHVRAHEIQWVLPVIFGVLTWLALLLREGRLRPLLPFRL